MSRPALLHFDTLDDRREIHRLLQLLHPKLAVEWLDRQCKKVTAWQGSRPGPSKRMAARIEDAIRRGGEYHYRLATEVYFDAWMLASQYGIDLGSATKELEEAVKRQCRT